MLTRKTLLIIGMTIVVVVCIILGMLWQTGYLLTEKRVVTGKGLIPMDWPTVQEYIQEQNTSNQSLPNLFFFLLNQTRQIPGIDKITLEVFYSNDSIPTVKTQYRTLLGQAGYNQQAHYSGSYSQWDQTMYYWTFTHGISGVVLLVGEYQGKTWICYATGNVFDMLQIYNYLSYHGYIQ